MKDPGDGYNNIFVTSLLGDSKASSSLKAELKPIFLLVLNCSYTDLYDFQSSLN